MELGEASWRTTNFEEVWEEARVRKEAAKLRAAGCYNTRVRECTFQKGDLVWRKVAEARRNKEEGKLAQN